MSLSLYDTLTAAKKPFEPEDPGHARIYVCGPTTYDDAHIGHARPCIVYDVLVRHLRASGMKVTYVRNVTDVDDNIIKRAAQNNEEPAALAARMFVSYSTDMARLHNLSPDAEPKVSEHLEEIRALIARLIERGHAYESAGDVYFDVASDKNYGKLSHRDLSQMEAGASERLDESEAARKRHPFDFALWKGISGSGPSWPSPWGPGRPGWHIECSAMSMKYLGESFDLHGGGLDLVFPHHENELAQSECATGKCFSRHWMHNGFVQINKEKMSKSLGNFFRLREAFDKVEPEAVRYSLMTVHYRSPYNLEMDLDDAGGLRGFPQFSEAEDRLRYLYSAKERFAQMGPEKIKDVEAEIPAEIGEYVRRVTAVLNDDLNTAQAIAHLSGLLKAVNEMCDQAQVKKGSVARVSHEAAVRALEFTGEVLGLGLDNAAEFLERVRDRRAIAQGIDCAWVESCLVRRSEARKNKDFAQADVVRDELSAKGVEMLDTPAGTSWRLVK
jgi:cysteinyl-tRNA synthetase